MMHRWSSLSIMAAAACLLAAGSASASPLNTGVNPDGSVITPGGIDAAWTGVDVSGESPVAVTSYAVSGYYGFWTPGTNAEYLSPNQLNGQADNYPNPNSPGGASSSAFINWSQAFTLTSNQAATDLLGAFAVDNQLVALVVNGHTVSGLGGGGFSFMTSFDIPYADLLAGANLITFETENYAGDTGNPTGLLVEFTPQPVPEPASLALLGAGLIGLTLVARRSLPQRP